MCADRVAALAIFLAAVACRQSYSTYHKQLTSLGQRKLAGDTKGAADVILERHIYSRV